ncbi:hypothetical protein [Sutcliffiella rhizosphaerae]|uniref:Uncharacterized protein n=1 Tax=Sutcliffiella rhizosphaerae TaxID=2880967 RepID=A0ABM8YRA3_9BACI|nr:hypothetical protein [Sutcliffiella rhizosphaerae]CAG9622502.1 hypothetical protein BACCIP111883_03293 [Sutcliffiella rhizosphaerae]
MDYYQSPHHYNQHEDNRNSFHSDNDNEEVSLGQWLIILILLAIPFLNIIVMLFLAFGDHNQSIKNFAKASLIMIVIGFLFTGLLSVFSL